jgi:hypothetical protein
LAPDFSFHTLPDSNPGSEKAPFFEKQFREHPQNAPIFTSGNKPENSPDWQNNRLYYFK